MIFRQEYRDGVWVDLEQPSEEEIRQIAREFYIDERLERELLSPTPLPLVIGDQDMVLLVLHFPTQGDGDGETKSQEVDFIVGEHFVITVRYEIIAPLHHLKKLLEAQQMVVGKAPVTTDVLLEILFAHLYTAMRDHVNHTANTLARVEKDMFDGHERRTVRSVSNVSREFLHVEAMLSNQEESLHNFLTALMECGFFDTSFSSRVQRIFAERVHVARVVKTHREMASELRQTNIALIEARQNEIMKTLTTITVIVFPLELIAVIFAMDLPGAPFREDPHGFYIVIAGMFSLAVLMTFFFAKKRWIF